jgi:hypothetical protein
MLRADPKAAPAELNRPPGGRVNCRIAKVRRHRYLGAFPAPPPGGETWPPKRRGAVAQMGERCNRTAEVRGSIPLSSTSLRS